jgi:thioredoxin 1
MAELQSVTDQNFDEEVLKANLPVLVDFWAPWCGPCRMVAPVVEAIASENTEKLKVVKINTDENPDTPSQYHVSGLPSLLLFKNGQVADQIVGAVPKARLQDMLAKHI